MLMNFDKLILPQGDSTISTGGKRRRHKRHTRKFNRRNKKSNKTRSRRHH